MDIDRRDEGLLNDSEDKTSLQSGAKHSNVAAEALNEMSSVLYQAIAGRDNLVFSPLGIYCVLSMLHQGARGETRRILSHMFPEADQAALRRLLRRLRWLMARRPDDELSTELSIAAAIWIQEGYACSPAFVESVHEVTEGEVAALDFAGRPDAAATAISDWVREKTRGLCGPMVSGKAISPLTKAVLGTALYYKARWAKKFDEPKPGPFDQLDGEKLDVQMMAGRFSHLSYVRHADYWGLELPYRDGPASMVVLVPNSRGQESLSALESQIGPGLREVVGAASDQEVALTMPQFRIKGSHGISDDSDRLGLGHIFSPEADFSGITVEPGLRIDRLLHDAYINVDRYGTEAAAATLAVMDTGIYTPAPEPIVLTIDRPFVFAVLEKVSGAILFLGRVVRPE